jgi:hypothetical protein
VRFNKAGFWFCHLCLRVWMQLDVVVKEISREHA